MALTEPAAGVADEWLWGWDPTPRIVSVWADSSGRAYVWRRLADPDRLVREEARFRPWLLLDRLDDLNHLGSALGPEGEGTPIAYRELAGTGALRYLVSAADGRRLRAAVLLGASRRTGKSLDSLRDLGKECVLALSPEEQYLVVTGRTYFRDLAFDELRRLQFDLETTGLNADRHRIFMIAVRDPDGSIETLEAGGDTEAAEGDLIQRLVARVQAADPDVIENHNLHGFDLPFLAERARRLKVVLPLGRLGSVGLRERASRRGAPFSMEERGRTRFVAPGREFIDTMDAVWRYDFSTRDLPSHGLKAVARHLGLARPDREYIRGAEIYDTYRRDPERVRRYASDDVQEVAGVARTLGGAAFALARMAPRRYETLADAGAATGVIDPLLVRAYLRCGQALPAHEPGDGTPHSGAALHLFATGVARRVVKADVASLYPSLMRAYRIGPSRDRLGAMLALVDRLVDQRLAAKARARAAPPGSSERHLHEGTSAAMKLVINSAYGYLAAGGDLTRFADVHAANEVTRRGREILAQICRELSSRGVILIEADTDGVYFSVPEGWSERAERRVVAEVAALLPPLVQLEFEGRYRSMLSHEPKNYALLQYDGTLVRRGVAFRSSRAEPFADAFLARAIERLLHGDIPGVREAYVAAVDALQTRALPTRDVSARARLTRSPDEYLERRERRRELPYEAVLSSGRSNWSVGERVRVYRLRSGEGRIVPESDEEAPGPDTAAARDYDVAHYVRVLRDSFASRLAKAFTPHDFATVFADPDQLSLFEPSLSDIRAILTPVDVPGPVVDLQ
jgi:DNA polymerase elongation subunit (family B)